MKLLIFAIIINLVNAVSEFSNCISGEKQMIFTFDDGPDIATEGLLEVLNRYNIKGIFFVNGIKVMKYRRDALMIQMYNQQHIMATHTFSHPAMSGLNDFNKLRELYDNEFYVFRRLFNNRPYLIRSPYFDYNDYILNNIYSQFGYVEIDASFESTDWMMPEDPNRVINATKAQIDMGVNIVNLLHDHIYTNVQVLEPIIQYAISKNYVFTNPQNCFGLTYSYQPENMYGPNLVNGINAYANP